MMMTGDDLSVLHRALEKTVKEPVSMYKISSIPPETLFILRNIVDVPVKPVGRSGRVVGTVAEKHPTVTLVVVAGVIVGVIYVSSGTSYLIAADEIAGQYVSYQYSAVSYLYSFIPYLSASYVYSLIPTKSVKFALGSYNLLFDAMMKLYETSQFGIFLRIAEMQLSAVLMPLLQGASNLVAEQYAKYVTERQAIKRAKCARLQAQLPTDLTPYQKCPLSLSELKHPVKAMLSNGAVKYFEREFLASWINFQIERNLPLVDPTSLLELPYRSADELVVDQEALKIIETMRELEALGN